MEAVMRSRLLEDALTVLGQENIAANVENGGPHFKVRFRNRFGRDCCLVVSRSPSTSIALQQSRAVLRRLMRSPPITRANGKA
jgi:hypothetical protein